MTTIGPRYFGFVNGGASPIALASGWLGMAWDQNAALPVMSPVAARLHEVTRNWLVQLFGLPYTSEAAFVTGATMANVTALAAARDCQLARPGLGRAAPGPVGSTGVDRGGRRQGPFHVVQSFGTDRAGSGSSTSSPC